MKSRCDGVQPDERRRPCSPPPERSSDTNPKYMGCPSRDMYLSVRVVGELDTEFLVDGALVGGVRVGQHHQISRSRATSIFTSRPRA